MNAAEVTKKDLLLLYRDRRTLFVLVALPLAFISILGFSTGQLFSEGQKNRTVQVGLLDADQSDLSMKVVSEIYKIKTLNVTEYPDRAAANMALAKDKVDVLVVIGPQYDERVNELELTDIFHADEGRLAGKLKALDIDVQAGSFLANASEIVRELVFGFALRTMAATVLKKYPKIATQIQVRATRESRERAEESQQKFDDYLNSAASETEQNPQQPESAEGPRTFTTMVYQILVPSYTVMFVFFIVTFMSRSFIAEREMGTLNRLNLAPISRSGLLIGKTVPFLVISLVQTALLFAAGKLFFGMSWGAEPWLLLPVMFCTSLAATALGLMVSTIVRTESQVSAYGNFLVLTMAGISGCMMPRSWQPPLMRDVGLATPHAWALIAYDQILSRPTTEPLVVFQCCLTLLGFALGFFAVGWWRFREME